MWGAPLDLLNSFGLGNNVNNNGWGQQGQQGGWGNNGWLEGSIGQGMSNLGI